MVMVRLLRNGNTEGMGSKETQTFPVVFERDEDGGYAVMCPSIPGCISQGDTVEQATANIRDAIVLCLEDIRARGGSMPRPTEVTTGFVDIAV